MKKVTILKNGTVVTGQGNWKFLTDGAVAFDEDQILMIGESKSVTAQYPEAERIDAKGGYILPALVNPHEHSYSAGVRGMMMTKYAPTQFMENLTQKWWNLDRWLTPEQIRLGTLAFYLDAAKCGVTVGFEHHASYGAIEGSLDWIGEAAEQAGIRVCAGFEVSNRWGEETAARAIRENVRWIKACEKRGTGQLCGTMALHASFTLSDETFSSLCSQYDGKKGCHIHIAECREDTEDAQKKYGRSICDRLERYGLLNERTLIAHGVYLSDGEMEQIRQKNACVVNNPESNMSNAVGCPPTERLLQKGIVTGLGMDGFTHDMFLSWRIANALYKHERKDINAAWSELPEMIFVHNPTIAERFFGRRVGVLETGAAPDLMVLRYDAPTPITEENFSSHMLFGMNASNVAMTICGGRVIAENGVCLTLDEERIMYETRKEMEKLWKLF